MKGGTIDFIYLVHAECSAKEKRVTNDCFFYLLKSLNLFRLAPVQHLGTLN